MCNRANRDRERSSSLVRMLNPPTTEDNTQPHSHLQLQLYDCNKTHSKGAILGARSQMWSERCA